MSKMYMLAAKYKAFFAVFFALGMAFVLSPVAFAQTNEYLSTECGANDPFCIEGARVEKLGDEPLLDTITSIINVALSLLGIVAVVIILIGGFKWMTAGGSEDKVADARKLIFSGIIGIAIILSAWAIANFVLSALVDATGAGVE